jgi:fructose-1,6-bisphosphatase II / sedoheptulose-1,7-bisphosphatase
MHCAEESTGIDMYMGSGGAPEGVLAAAALKCMGGQMFGRLLFRNDDERAREKAGITNLNRVYTRDDMVTKDVIFAATGVTDGSILPGIKREPAYLEAATILMRSKTGVGAAHDLPQPALSAPWRPCLQGTWPRLSWASNAR